MVKSAEEILKDFKITSKSKYHSYDYLYKTMIEAMKSYATEHVRQALKAAAKESNNFTEHCHEDAILYSYDTKYEIK